MFRRTVCVSLVAALIGFVAGCEKPPVSTTPDAPIKTSDGVDKKGKKSKSMDASLEDPTAKR